MKDVAAVTWDPDALLVVEAQETRYFTAPARGDHFIVGASTVAPEAAPQG